MTIIWDGGYKRGSRRRVAELHCYSRVSGLVADDVVKMLLRDRG